MRRKTRKNRNDYDILGKTRTWQKKEEKVGKLGSLDSLNLYKLLKDLKFGCYENKIDAGDFDYIGASQELEQKQSLLPICEKIDTRNATR